MKISVCYEELKAAGLCVSRESRHPLDCVLLEQSPDGPAFLVATNGKILTIIKSNVAPVTTTRDKLLIPPSLLKEVIGLADHKAVIDFNYHPGISMSICTHFTSKSGGAVQLLTTNKELEYPDWRDLLKRSMPNKTPGGVASIAVNTEFLNTVQKVAQLLSANAERFLRLNFTDHLSAIVIHSDRFLSLVMPARLCESTTPQFITNIINEKINTAP